MHSLCFVRSVARFVELVIGSLIFLQVCYADLFTGVPGLAIIRDLLQKLHVKEGLSFIKYKSSKLTMRQSLYTYPPLNKIMVWVGE